ncbi:MAG: tyrosine-type recombinase/integrase [Verrucomicrobia bacterium]|nr:tyrosine-type recombinase/integrase [Verrucomicrobiota bacterium]
MRKPFYPSAPSDEKGLEYFYIDRRALADFRRGPLGGYFDGFAAGLKHNGYANKTACIILGPCCVFNAFLIERGIKDLAAISDALVGEFLAAYLGEVRSTCSRYRPRDNCLAHLKHLFLYLEAIKVMAFPRPAPVITKHSWLLDPYAIILVLMAYGVRAVSAAHLSLEDLDWPQAKIRFRAQKGGKEVLVPLLDAVGEAIIQWLRHRDPRTPYREVFLSTKAPHGSLSSMAVSNVVKHYMLKAGVHQPGRGAHSLRHSWAIRALEHDQPIKAIADVLGHRYIDTTYIYAKADLKTLRQVAMPWPRR